MASERWQLTALDALRGIAMLMVLLVHSYYWGPDHIMTLRSEFLSLVFRSGQRGVQLFFLISAFTLYMSFENRRQESSPMRNFFLRRFFRLTPMFYVATLIGLLFWREIMGPASNILLSMAYLNNFSPTTVGQGAPGTWSISTEAVFYACLPVFFRYVTSVKRAACLLALAGAYRWFAEFVLVRRFGNGGYWLFASFIANLGVFAMGILLYFFWRDVLRNLPKQVAMQWSVAAIAAAVTIYIERPPNDTRQLLAETLPAVLLTIGLLLHPWRLIVNRATIYFGKISFSFYLLHFCVMHLIEKGIPSLGIESHAAQIALVFVSSLVIVTGLASLTWRYIEEPGIRLGRKLIEHLEHRRLVPSFNEQQF